MSVELPDDGTELGRTVGTKVGAVRSIRSENLTQKCDVKATQVTGRDLLLKCRYKMQWKLHHIHVILKDSMR